VQFPQRSARFSTEDMLPIKRIVITSVGLHVGIMEELVRFSVITVLCLVHKVMQTEQVTNYCGYFFCIQIY